MKEIISVVLMVVSLYAGTKALQEIHDTVRRVALEKASQGLPSLTGMVRAIKKQKGGGDTTRTKK